jgi:hypothetical protein
VGKDRLSRSANASGAILHPQPPPWDNEVSRGETGAAFMIVLSWGLRENQACAAA